MKGERGFIMAEESEPPYSTINRRLILVEDDPLVRGALRRSLATQGYGVLEFGCAEDLLDLLDAQAFEPDLLISDVRLPGLDGISLAEQLSERFPRLHVLLISGYLDDSQLRRVHRCPQFFFQPKPFVGVDLTRLVADILKSVA
jgi:two-component system cell cycle sensor histidine kinase/response regulator CckA